MARIVGSDDLQDDDLPMVTATPDDFKGTVVDSQAHPVSTLQTYMEGTPWAVDYYRQLIGENETPKSIQQGLDAAYQTYERISGFILKVTQPLAQTQNDNNAMSVTGSANVYAVIKPNVGDLFIADVGDGREALITVTKVERRTILTATTWEIQYTIQDWNGAKWAAELEKKVILQKYFDIERMRVGDNPVLTSEEREYGFKFAKHYSNLLDLFMTDFFSRVNSTLLVPDQTVATYDPFVTEFMRSIITSEEHPLLRDMHLLNVTGDRRMYEQTIWSCLEKLDAKLVGQCTQRMGIVTISHFKSRPAMNSVYWSRIGQVIYPDERGTSIDQHYYNQLESPVMQLGGDRVRYSSLDRAIPHKVLLTDASYGLLLEQQPITYAVTVDDYYVFSEAFYKGTDGQSLLENLTLDALHGRPLNLKALDRICEYVETLPDLERYYYIPVVLLLVRIHSRGI